MTAQKHRNLLTYIDDLKARLSVSDVPSKHQDSPAAYKEYLALELRRTQLRLENDPVVEPKSK